MVYSAAFSPDGKRVVTASDDKTARVWDADSGKPLASLQGHTARVRSAAFSPDGKRVVTASEDNTARVWDADSGKTLASLQGHTETAPLRRVQPRRQAGRHRLRRQDGAGLGRRLRQDPRLPPGAHRTGPLRRVQPRRQAGRHRLSDKTARVWPLDPIEGNAGILPLWVEAYTGTELLQGGAVQGLAAEEWKTRCRQLKTAIEQGAKAPPSKWLDELLAQP